MAASIPNPDWVYHLLGWSLLAGGIALAFAVLFHDRSRGRRRCPRCWYNLAGVPGLTCPECGRTAKGERRLAKTRRRWRWIPAAALLMLLGYAIQLVPQARARGWPSAVPTTALIVASPWLVREAAMPPFMWNRTPPTDWRDILYRELNDERLMRERLHQWQWWLLAEVCLLRADERSVSRHYASGHGVADLLAVAANAGKLTPSQLARAEVLTSVRLDCRSTWPVGVPLHATLVFSRWNARDTTRLTMEPVEPGPPRMVAEREPFYIGGCGLRVWFPWSDHHDLMPAPTALVPAFRYEATFERGSSGAWRLLCRRPVTLPVRIVPSVADVVRPVRDQTLAKALRDESPPRLHVESSGYYLQWAPSAEVLLAHGGHTLAVRVEVLSGSEVALTGEAWWWAQPSAGTIPAMIEPMAYSSVPLRPTGVNRLDPGYLTVRLTSDATMALRNFNCDTYWDGTFELPAVSAEPLSLQQQLWRDVHPASR